MSGVQSGIRTPGVYTAVNINTQRTGLIPNEQKVLFVTTDPKELDQPIAIYDTWMLMKKLVRIVKSLA